MPRYVIREFCLNTGLHGYRFLFLPKRVLLERIIWLVLVIASVISAIVISWFAWRNTQKYIVLTVTDSTHHPIWNYPFPAVTVCGFNQISKSKLQDVASTMNFPYGSHQYDNLKYITQLLPGYAVASKETLNQVQDMLEHNNITPAELLQKITPNCTEILQRCKWKGEEKRCEILFEQIKTSLGYCCSFNYYAIKNHTFSGALPNKSPKMPRRVTGCGYKTGLEIMLDNKQDDYYATNLASYGYKLLIHYPFDFVDWSVRTLLLDIKSIMFINVSPILTKCSSVAAELRVTDRGCVFSNELELNNFKYTYHNCLTECRAKIVISLCDCIPFYHYNENGTLKANRICNLRDISCLAKIRDLIMSSTPGVIKDYNSSENLDPCSCIPNCNYCHYPIEFSSGGFTREYAVNEYSFYGHGIPIKNQSVFRVFFNDLTATRNTRVVRYYWHTLFALFGGVIGLFTGFSFVSAFELVHFFIMQPLMRKLQLK